MEDVDHEDRGDQGISTSSIILEDVDRTDGSDQVTTTEPIILEDIEYSENKQAIDATDTITQDKETAETHADYDAKEELSSAEDNKCPVARDGEKEIHQNNDQSKEHAETATVHDHVKSIPYQWWRPAFANMLQLKYQGHNYLIAGTESNDSTVYNLKFDEYRIMVCDHLGMEALFDLDNVKRDTRFGFAKFNPIMLKEHVPCVFSYDAEHKKRKEFLLNFFKGATQHLTINDIVEAIKVQFEKMEPIHFEDDTKAEMFDFEHVMKTAVSNVMTYFLLGDYIEDSKLIYEWQEKTLKLPFSKKSSKSEEMKIANDLFEKIESTKNVKELKDNTDTSELTYEEMVSEIVWGTCFNSIGGTKNMVISSLLCFLRLAESDKQLLKQEAEIFLAASKDFIREVHATSNYEDVLPTLTNINAFYMEVMRLHPPVTSNFGRAKKDFVLKSTSGNFQVKENSLLCGYPYMAQRDPKLFENPDCLLLNRSQEEVKRYNFAFGGYFLGESTDANHKCPGQAVANNIIKVFIAFITRCTVTPVGKTAIYTGRNYGRFEGSDEPLRVLHFSYNN